MDPFELLDMSALVTSATMLLDQNNRDRKREGLPPIKDANTPGLLQCRARINGGDVPRFPTPGRTETPSND
jgi:hypothetical protein